MSLNRRTNSSIDIIIVSQAVGSRECSSILRIKKMPVSNLFSNKFGAILNDALFDLKKKQMKEPGNVEIFTKKKSTKFVSPLPP